MIPFHKIVCTAALLLAASAGYAQDKASGTLNFKTWSGAVKFGWMVRSPDEMDASKSILRIYLSSADIGARIRACSALAIAGHPRRCGSLGAPNRSANHARTIG